MAVLEGAARVPVALLLTVHHAALHGVLDLRGEGRSARTPPQEARAAREAGPRVLEVVSAWGPPQTRQAQGPGPPPPDSAALSEPFVG